MRLVPMLLAVLVAIPIAEAQPADPYGPPPPPAPVAAPPPPVAPGAPVDPYGLPPPPAATRPVPSNVSPAKDPVLDEQVARALVSRAQELYDARVFVDAKQLAVEALAKSPGGAASEQARFLINAINNQLGIRDTPTDGSGAGLTAPLPSALPPPGIPPQPEAPGAGDARLAARVHGALYAGLIGTTIGAFFSRDTPAGGAVPLGLAFGVAGGLYLPRVLDRLHWSEAQLRTTGAASVWGGVIGGLFADAVSLDASTARQVLVGASIGATVGALGGAGIARRDRLTRGDVALIDTLAGVGAVGGLTLGMLMQPAEGEAYSVNAMLGAGGGLVVGYIAAPLTNTTPRRVLRVAGAAALGGSVPFLLYAAIYDRNGHGDERAVGALSTIGLVAGLYVGLRLTRDLDVGLDVRHDGGERADDAPVAIVGRHSDGRWALGGLTVQPLSAALASQPGMIVPLVGGRL